MQFSTKSWVRPARLAYSFSILALTASLAACGGTATVDGDLATDSGESVSGSIQIDGSSTVLPVSEAMAEEFEAVNPDARVVVGKSGTGGGFKKFCAGETDISNASRPVKDAEAAECAAAGIEFIEVPIAYDGITVVTHPSNDWAQCLTVEQLSAAWGPDAAGSVTNWNQLDPAFPDEELVLFGPGVDSGTFDYFTDEVNGEEGASRDDYTSSEDDNIIVKGVAAANGGMGYFGYAYYEENQGALKAVDIKNESGECISPSTDTIADGSYSPMSRPLFFYVSKAAYDAKPVVQAFVNYQLSPENSELVQEVGYIPLPEADLAASKARVEQGKLGRDPS